MNKITVKDSDSFKVNFVIYKKKQLNLKVNITGAPDDLSTASKRYIAAFVPVDQF